VDASSLSPVSVLDEPALRFGFGQSSTNPKEGLFLFGPTRDHSNPTEIRCGVVGTPNGIRAYRAWVEQIAKPISPPNESTISVFYPGFRELFGCVWSSTPVVEIPISHAHLASTLHRSDRHDAIHSTVSIFSDPINGFLREDDRRVDVWFVVIPDEVFDLGRPQSRIPSALRVQSIQPMNARLAKKLSREPSLFPEDMKAAEPYLYQLDFHNQLKARLIRNRAITQVIRESTLQQETQGAARRRMQDAASIAWNLSVSSFYKAGGRPWRLRDVRDGVCYVGLVFKRDNRGSDQAYACCGAQMFLTSGEGMVFKGTPGPWFSPASREFHLSQQQAAEIAVRIVKAYTAEIGRAPTELFIHGRTRFNDEEWAGFKAAMPASTQICGVRISRTDEFKLFRPGRMPVIRGTTVMESEKVAYLWTSGFVPELSTYPGWEVPNPLRVEVCRGNAALPTVVADVLKLTKLNFNACIYADGLPVTLRFADAIGEILTAAPPSDIPEAPLPFRHYI
jgi:hypothetical protein